MRLGNWIPVLTAALAACVLADDAATGAFDDDENDDAIGVDSKEDGTGTGPMTYRSGCGAPIRTGTYVLHGDVVLPTGVAPNYYVTVTDEKIAAISPFPPTNKNFVETN